MKITFYNDGTVSKDGATTDLEIEKPEEWVLDSHERSMNLIRRESVRKHNEGKIPGFKHGEDFYRLKTLTISSVEELSAVGWGLREFVA